MDSGGSKEPCEGVILRGKYGQPRTCPVVDLLKAIQQVAEPVWCGCQLGVLDMVDIGATWRIRLTCLCVVELQPYVRLALLMFKCVMM